MPNISGIINKEELIDITSNKVDRISLVIRR